jgi:hypothetical protein
VVPPILSLYSRRAYLVRPTVSVFWLLISSVLPRISSSITLLVIIPTDVTETATYEALRTFFIVTSPAIALSEARFLARHST